MASGVFAAAGAVATCGAAAAAPPALGAALAALGGIASNVIAPELNRRLASRLSDLRTLLTNHDLTRAVGQAIALVLQAEALDRKGAPPSEGLLGLLRRGGRHDDRAASVLEALANAVPEWWPGFVERNREKPSDSLLGSLVLTDDDIAAYFSAKPEQFAEVRALTTDEWQRILGVLVARENLGRSGLDLEGIANRLHEQFPLAMREIVKHDAVTGGKSFPALILMLLGDISGSIRDLQASLDIYEEREQERHAALKALLSAVPRIEAAGREIRATLDPEQYKEVIARFDAVTQAVHDEGEKTRSHMTEESDRIITEVGGVIRGELGIVQRQPSNLPFLSLGNLFKGREEFLETIGQALADEGGAAAIRAAAIHAMGGIGKTRATIEYAHRHRERYTALLFVRADSAEGLRANLGALCDARVLDLPEKDAREAAEQDRAALRWLQRHKDWLVILDNVDHEDVAREVERLVVQVGANGHILITSRLSRWQGSVASLELGLLDEDAAVAFLLERTDGKRIPQEDDPDRALELAIKVGCLALMLEQAAAYIARRGLTFAEYLTDWEQRHAQAVEWSQGLTGYDLRVVQTLATTFERLTPPARRLLDALAWLAPDPIPETLLDVEIEGVPDLRDALGELAEYHLVERHPRQPEFTVHTIVQDVARHLQTGDGRSGSLAQALGWVNEAFTGDPADVRTWPVLLPLAPHARSVTAWADRQGIAEPTARLMNQLGALLYARADYAQAEPLIRRALQIEEDSYGKAPPKGAVALNNLAALLRATNRLAEAEPLMRRALRIYEDSYGKDHPNVATALNNLAQLLKATNRLAEAEPLMRRALQIGEDSYGKDHPEVAMRLNNLAALLLATNRLAEAEPLMRRALQIDEDSYGKDHPNVAIRLNNLAQLLKATNRLAEAEPLMRRALAILAGFQRASGHEHPNFRTAIGNYVRLLTAMGFSDDVVRTRIRKVLEEGAARAG
jgi:tetratricopeptide (TPR) repeat protein